MHAPGSASGHRDPVWFALHYLAGRARSFLATKLHMAGNKTDILLLRTGEQRRGVVGLFQPGLPGEVSPSLSVRLMGIDQRGVASYLVSLYCSAAILTEDALGALESVEVDLYYDYK